MTASAPTGAGGASSANADDPTVSASTSPPDASAVSPDAGPSPLAERVAAGEEDPQQEVSPQGIGAKIAKKARPSSGVDALELKGPLPGLEDLGLPPGIDSPEQLILPLGDQAALVNSGAIAHQSRVFCNRHLKMTGISWVGFDMDYTLAIYNQERMDDLSIRATIGKLIAPRLPRVLAHRPARHRLFRCVAS